MSTEILVRATQGSNYGPGEIVDTKPGGHVWGRMEQPPDYIHLTISDADRNQVIEFLERWDIKFQHVLENQNANFWWITISVDPAYISASNVGAAELKSTVQDHVEGGSEYWQGTTVVSFTSSSMTVKIPKNGVYQTANGLSALEYLKVLKSDFADIFDTVLDPKRYYFSAEDVATVLAAGGSFTLTKAQALNNIIDKLSE